MLPATSTPAVNNRTSRIYSKILVAIDGSDPSMNAAEHAISVSEAFSAELHALHVIQIDVDLFGPADTPHDVIQMNKQAQEFLNRVKLKGNKKYEIKTEIIISVNVPRGIVKYAENKNIDLIIVGTRGRSGFRKLLLGSVASSVIEYSHCPVLVIR
jgi:nucleotide-binding universal stress UspA family protein